MFAPRTRAAIGLLCGLGLLALSPERAAPDEKPKAPEPKKPDLSKLPNDDLLKQATAILARASGDYRAAARALAGIEAQLADSTKQLASLAPPAEPKKADPKDKPASTEEAAKAAADAAKDRAEFAARKLKLTKAHKDLQERLATAVEGVQSAASAFQTALDELKPFAVEIELRFQDGTMTGALPVDLLPESQAKQQKALGGELERIKERLTQARKAVELAAKTVGEAEKALSTADAEATEAGRVYARELQRKDTEKMYAGKKPEEMLAELNRLVQDGIGLKGTYELAYREFTNRAADAERLRKELADLKRPEVMIPQITRAEDVQQAAKAVEALIGYYTARVQKIETLRTHLTALARSGAVFEADAAVSDDHLFKMQVVAGLLEKAGLTDKLPEQAGKKRLAEAAERAMALAAEVRAAAEKARADLPELERTLTEARTAGAAAGEQLAALQQTRDVTLAAIQFEDEVGKLSTAQVVDKFNKLRQELTAKTAALKTGEDEFKRTTAAVVEARARFEALKDPLLRAAEEQGQAERQRIVAELRKEGGLDPAAPAAPSMPAAEPKKLDEKEKKAEEKEKPKEQKPEPPPTPLDRVFGQLTGFQQQLAARVRVLDEREEKAKALLTALDELDAKATAYSKTLSDTRLTALRLNAAAVDIKKRVGRGELEPAKIPEGVTESLAVEGRKKLDADSAAVLNALSQTRLARDALRKPDPEADALKALSKELLAVVGQRIDLLNDLKKLAADYKVAAKDRPVSERKRLEQTASDRMDRDAGRWDWVLTVDQSKQATNLVELLESYYREVVEIEDRDENLKKQQGKINELIDLVAKERAVVLKGVPMLDRDLARLELGREEATVLTRSRLKPESTEELLRAFQAKTGRVLPKPIPLGEKDRAAKIEEFGNELFERYVEVEAARRWSALLAARLGTAALTAEAGAYQDELADLNATGGANTRRVQTLTGNEVPEPGKISTGEQTKLPARAGEIGKTRGELNAVRSRGAQRIGIKVAIILLVAFLLPRVFRFLLIRALGRDAAGNSSMVVTAVGAFVKVLVWVAAFALTLSVLGFDVTAIVAGLGIGGLAIGLAAQPMIADVLGAVIIFAEGRFRIGDVVKLGAEEPARVVGLTWRSTALKNADGVLISVPNRKVTETTVQNLTRAGHTYDWLSATVTTEQDVARVLAAVKKAMEGCANLSPDHGVSVKKFTHKGSTKIVEYRVWWFLKDYESRNQTRDEVFAHIGAELAQENLPGTEVTLA
jgi:small-conductance mechanosensitive channel